MSEVKHYFWAQDGMSEVGRSLDTYVKSPVFDRVTAELVSANSDKEAYAQNAIDLRKRVDALQALLTAADERADVLEADVREKECLLLKCMEAFNNCVGMSSQATRSKWYEVYLKPVSGSVLVHFSKGIQRAFGKPAESDDTTIEEERDDAKKVFVRTNTKQGQSISLDDMLARYERKP